MNTSDLPPPHRSDEPASAEDRRAVQYMRMSSDYQRYSIASQADRIREYAASHGLTIVRTYADEGRSGLRLQGRRGLQQLLADVASGHADFSVILVYDVSRWGRFQDVDESAYHEYTCRRAGIRVAYCAETFENDGSPISTLLKGLKRAMAAEFSRELSHKVFTGQSRQVELGYRQGGFAGYGLRREIIAADGASRGVAERGEHKNIRTDRIILRPGPAAELAVVQQIYDWFIDDGLSEYRIAARLNTRGLLTDLGVPWTKAVVRGILFNEKYIGENVYNRRSSKLLSRQIRNDPSAWIRRPEAFEPVVTPARFQAARAIREARARRLDREDMIERLRQLHQQHGYLSRGLIDRSPGMTSSSYYRKRFGNMLTAYAEAGYVAAAGSKLADRTRMGQPLSELSRAEATRQIVAAGGVVGRDPTTGHLLIDGQLRLRLTVMSPFVDKSLGTTRWRLRCDLCRPFDMVLAVRTSRETMQPIDYFLLPQDALRSWSLVVSECESRAYGRYRFESLDGLYDKVRQLQRQAAGGS